MNNAVGRVRLTSGLGGDAKAGSRRHLTSVPNHNPPIGVKQVLRRLAVAFDVEDLFRRARLMMASVGRRSGALSRLDLFSKALPPLRRSQAA